MSIEPTSVSNFQNLGGGWAEEALGVFIEHHIHLVSYVPDGGLSKLIQLCHDQPSIQAVSLTTEEEGIAFAAGAWLGGKRSALLMQSSGVGNCINMLGLIKTCQFPLLTLITMRGEWGEFNPWQIPMGQAAPKVLETMGVVVMRVDETEAIRETLEAAIRLTYSAYQPVALLLSQRLLGTKKFGGKP